MLLEKTSKWSDFPDLRVLATAKDSQEFHGIKAYFKICPSWTTPPHRDARNKENIRKGQE